MDYNPPAITDARLRRRGLDARSARSLELAVTH
jgi:hypothetical protein